jgi:uncharacterized OsmC-like protein
MTYSALARTTDTYGRYLCTVRDHHFISDGPAFRGLPAEEVTPAELFLAGIAACGVELVQVFGREEGLPLRAARCQITADGRAPTTGRTVFQSVRLEFVLDGVSAEQGAHLVERFEGA